MQSVVLYNEEEFNIIYNNHVYNGVIPMSEAEDRPISFPCLMYYCDFDPKMDTNGITLGEFHYGFYYLNS